MSKQVIGVFVLAVSLSAAPPLDPAVAQSLASIRASELKGDLSFLASDVLQGRYTPSPGLDIAAEFIASKFRLFGLKPVNTQDYFQIADMIDRTMPHVQTPLHIKAGSQTITIEPDKIQVTKANSSLSLNNAPMLKFAEADASKLKGVPLDGKVVLLLTPENASASQMQAFNEEVAKSKALAEVIVGPLHAKPTSRLLFAEEATAHVPPVIRVESADMANVTTSSAMTLSLEFAAPLDKQVVVKNVIGILRGSDPRLKSTCVLLTAHYDHIGTTDTARGLSQGMPNGDDHIYNGANDDGSGTVSVIEIARALSLLHPRRSIVFMTFFGEERGLLGSTYYSRHPVFPIAKTVADVNLEQVGRTDSSEGPEISNATVTGYDYSGVTRFLEEAGKVTGVRIYKDDSGSDPYFVRSDNAALAEMGVPAHTLATAYEYPDYHGLGDEWQKIDYENMAKVDRTVALAVLNIANSNTAPTWNAANPKTKEFRDAQAKEQSLQALRKTRRETQ